LNLYDIALRFRGLTEIAGNKHNDFISWAHSLCGMPPDTPDEVPWCSSFVNALAFIAGLPRSGSAAARSWLKVGQPITLDAAQRGDVVIVTRGQGPQPGPEVTSGATGHVGLYETHDDAWVWMVGGNQGNTVSVARFPVGSVLGVRRLT
jgi:uncharacterized protein (TIGR02594 family)